VRRAPIRCTETWKEVKVEAQAKKQYSGAKRTNVKRRFSVKANLVKSMACNESSINSTLHVLITTYIAL
jgi:hypothetical protein